MYPQNLSCECMGTHRVSVSRCISVRKLLADANEWNVESYESDAQVCCTIFCEVQRFLGVGTQLSNWPRGNFRYYNRIFTQSIWVSTERAEAFLHIVSTNLWGDVNRARSLNNKCYWGPSSSAVALAKLIFPTTPISSPGILNQLSDTLYNWTERGQGIQINSYQLYHGRKIAYINVVLRGTPTGWVQHSLQELNITGVERHKKQNVDFSCNYPSEGSYEV